MLKKGTRKVTFVFDEGHLTHYGGVWLIQQFCDRLGLRSLLTRCITIEQREGDYEPSKLLLALLFAIIIGLRRINKTDTLRYDGAILEMLGLSQFPDSGTLRRFLRRLPPVNIRQIAQLHDSLRAWLFFLPEERHSLVFDVDSIVLVVYGHAQGAMVGYNPKKQGRRSYHPLFCFESSFQEFWHGIWRRGNAASSTGIIPFLKVCLAKVPATVKRQRIRFRMDSGFFGKRVVEFLDDAGCGYVIVAKEYSTIKAAARRVHFTKLQSEWEYGEFECQPDKWQVAHRFVVVRRPIPEDPIEAKQLTLFKDCKYSYHVFVTNLDLDAWRVYLFYCGRANIEKSNREFLYDYPLGKIPTQKWTANVAFFQLVLLAANLVHWFKRLCLQEPYTTATVETIRTDLLVIPSKLVRTDNRSLVKLPKDYPRRSEFLRAARAIGDLNLPEKFRICPKPPHRVRREGAKNLKKP
jgi:hypothetical protein